MTKYVFMPAEQAKFRPPAAQPHEAGLVLELACFFGTYQARQAFVLTRELFLSFHQLKL
jgi:hypothetical protein